jgi:hypothetical protein
MRQQRVDPRKYRFDWAEPVSQVKVNTSNDRIVAARVRGRIEMEADRIFQFCEGAIVKECRLKRGVPQWRRPKFVTIRSVARGLLQPEIFILAWTIEDDIALSLAEERRDLRHGGHMHFEVTEHLIGLPGNGVAGDASRLAEK